MATIAGSTNNSNWTYKLEVSESDVNINDNTSKVTVKAYIGRTNSRSYLGGSWSGSITVAGSSQSMSGTIPYPTYIDGGGWLLLATKTFIVTHNTDGSKIATISSSFSSSDFTPSSASASGSVSLTTIPRASSVSCKDGNIGENVTIDISRYSSAFKHTITYSFENLSDTIATDIETSYTWTIPTSFYQQIPNSNTGICTITCETYNGSTLIGTSTCTFKANVTNSDPEFTSSQLTYLDSNSTIVAITKNNQHIVRNNSNLKVTYTEAKAKNYATISRYEITFNGSMQTKSSAATINYGIVNLSANTTIYVKAIDSRGNSTTISKTIIIFDWVLPTAIIKAQRINNYEDDTIIKVQTTISSVNSKNAIQSIRYRYKKTSDESYGPYTYIFNDDEYEISIDKLYAYNLQFVVQDKFGQTTYNLTVPKGTPIMFIDVLLRSVGINCFPKNPDSFEVKGYKFDDNHPVNSIIMTSTNTNPSTSINGTWILLTTQTINDNTIYYWQRTE